MEERINTAKQYYTNTKTLIKDIYNSKRKELYSEDALKEFDNHVLNIFLSIATCHYPVSEEEVKFIESFFPQYKIKALLESENESITKEREGFILNKFPRYLNDINELDFSKYRAIVNMILEMCVELASVDEEFSEYDISGFSDSYFACILWMLFCKDVQPEEKRN